MKQTFISRNRLANSSPKTALRQRVGLLVMAVFTLLGIAAQLMTTAPALAAAGINSQINFQGRLLNAAGAVAPDGNYNIEFKIYTGGPGNVAGDTGGTLQWTEDWVFGSGSPDNRVVVRNGYFSVNLGSITSLSSVDFNSDTLWLSMNVGNTTTAASFAAASGDGEMLPMKRLTASPYAFNAGKLGGLAASAFGQLSAANTWSGTNLFQPAVSATALQVANASNAVFTVDTSGNNVVIGKPGAQTATLQFANATGTNVVGLQAGASTAAYTLTLPTVAPLTSQCLQSDATTATLLKFASCGSGTTYTTAALDTVANSGQGIGISGSTIFLQSASGTNPGAVNTTAQTFAGSKTFSAVTQFTPSASLTNGQVGINQTATFANATAAGIVIGIQQNITVSDTVASTTNKAFDLKVTDNQAAINHTNTGLAITLSGTNASQIQIGENIAVNAGIGINVSSTGVSGNGATCNNTGGSQSVAVCATATGSSGTGVYSKTTGNGSAPNSFAAGGTAVFGLSQPTASAGSFYYGVQGSTYTTSAAAYTSIGVAGIVVGGTGATAYGGYFDLDGSSNAALGSALYANNANATNGANIFQAASNGTAVTTIGATGATAFKNTSNSTAAFQVQNASGAPILLVDTATTPNLVTNPGFEVDVTTGWNYTSATGTRNTTKANTYHGQASDQISVTVAGGGANLTSFTSTITPAQYTFSFYAEKGTNAGTLSVVITGGSAPACTLVNYVAPVTTGFQRYTCTFTSTSTNVTQISINSSATGTFFLDAVELNTGATAAPYAAQGAVQLRGIINNPVTFQNAADATTAFQIQNAAGTSNLFVADTLNGQIVIGGANNTPLVVSGSGANETISIVPGTGAIGNQAYFAANSRARFGYNGSSVVIDTNGANKPISFWTGPSGNDQQRLTIDTAGGITINTFSTAGIVTNTAAGLLGSAPTVPVANGGTAINSYTTGDLLFASAAATLSKLSDVALGSCLISGGIGAAPSWGSCGGGGSGVTTVGAFSGSSQTNGATISGTTITFGPADGSNPGMVTTGSQTFAGVKTFAAGFTVAGYQVLQETTAPGGTTGFGKIYVSSSDHSLHFVNNAGTDTALGAGGGGGTHTKLVTLAPEYPSAVFSASGSNNTGYMSSGYVSGLTAGQGYKHNFYNWDTDQATSQTYDIVAQYQIPSDWGTGFVSGSWKIWTYADSLTSTGITWSIKDVDGTSCYASTQSALPASTGTWTQISLSDPGNGCTFTAGDVITLDVQPKAITPTTNTIKIGEIQFNYNTAY